MHSESSISPEESPDAQAVLNGHHYHVFMGGEDLPIIGRCPAHHQATSVDPHHHLAREEVTILVIGSRAWKDVERWFVLGTYLLAMTQEGHSSESISPQQSWSRRSPSFLIPPARARSPSDSTSLAAPPCLPSPGATSSQSSSG